MNWTEKEIEELKVKNTGRYKCHTCLHVVTESPCPCCGEEKLEPMCPLDHCNCHHGITESVEYCPLCGAPICPECGSHDVSQVSRVTGYLSEVSGWNQGKQQELKDRTRYKVA